MTDTRTRLSILVAEQLSIKPEDINDEATFDTLGADSLDRVEIIMKVEEAFGIEVDDAEAEKLTSFGALVAYVDLLRQRLTQA